MKNFIITPGERESGIVVCVCDPNFEGSDIIQTRTQHETEQWFSSLTVMLSSKRERQSLNNNEQ